MNFKKLAAVGVLALVVVGCVMAAGCTSTEDTATSIMDSIESELGNALAEYDFEDILSDLEENTTTETESDGVVVFSFHSETENGVTTGSYTINGETTKIVYTEDDLVGSWVKNYTDEYGESRVSKIVLNQDGTGTIYNYKENGDDMYTIPATWENTGVGFDVSYTFDGVEDTGEFLLTADKKTILQHDGSTIYEGFKKV